MAELDPQGNAVCSTFHQHSEASALATGADGSVWVAGDFEGSSFDLGNGPLTSKGDLDAFVARFSP